MGTMLSFKEYLSEATLTGKSTSGKPNIDKYVVDNPKALEIEYEIEKGKKEVPVYDKGGAVVGNTQEGTKFKLKSKKLYEIEGKTALDTSIGFIQINFIRKPSGFKAMDAELKATNELNQLIVAAVRENDGEGITVKIGKFTIKDVVGCDSEGIKGDPKADLALLDSNGKEVGFISHKKEGGAAGFQQYGGVSVKSGLRHKEIESFVDKLAKIYEKEKPKNGDAFYRPLKDKKLINASVYGPDFGGAFGRENVHCIGQGDPILDGKKGVYSLNFSETMHTNGDVSWAGRGKFLAVFGATFRQGRRVVSPKGKEVRNIRAGIYPIAVMQGRRKLQEV